MSRRCSLCSSRGHSKRTCSSRKSEEGGIIKLFGVRLTDTSFVKKSSSLGNLSHYTSTSAAASEGYHSDDPSHGFVRRQAHRKKGIPWTEEEHRQFLVGLQKLGKGDWKGISRNYVPTKTPTQVASHAQKYFIRQSEATRKKRRSLFDMVTDMEENVNASSTPDNEKLVNLPSQESNIINPKPSLDLSLKPVYMPLPFQLWPPTSPETSSSHQIHNESGKEFVGIAQFNLNETTTALVEPPTLSLMLPGDL